MKTYKEIWQELDELYDETLICQFNEYCIETRCADDCIYSMEEFDEILQYFRPWEIARAAFYGDFCPAHDWFWFNAYGNLESSDYIRDKINIDELADYYFKNQEEA